MRVRASDGDRSWDLWDSSVSDPGCDFTSEMRLEDCEHLLSVAVSVRTSVANSTLAVRRGRVWIYSRQECS